ncbi:MAG: hypothetical protein QXI58_06760 [Candidatus Micrarchaeia archaeon]
MALTMKKATTYGLGIAGGAVLNEVSKRISTATKLPVEYLNIGLGLGLMAFSDKIAETSDTREILELAGGVAAFGSIVSMIFKQIFGGTLARPAPVSAPVLKITPAPALTVEKEEYDELVKVD